ncbi:MAG: GNAT family N-acetyltransferase [Acidimicrobiaceae bacterium]|nr:GNAT family N-acetyltransferase [Acidimicrobiaceae bacterium]
MSTLHIRRSVAADLDALVELGAEYCAADGHRFDEQTVRAGFGGLMLDDTHGFVLVADDGSDDVGSDDGAGVIGYAAVSWGWSIEVGGLDVVLDEIYVRSRGHGVGGELLAAVEAECRRVGAKRIFLETERPNERARRWYAAAGFTIDDSIWMSKELG